MKLLTGWVAADKPLRSFDDVDDMSTVADLLNTTVKEEEVRARASKYLAAAKAMQSCEGISVPSRRKTLDHVNIKSET